MLAPARAKVDRTDAGDYITTMTLVMRAELIIFDYDGVLCRAETYTPEAIREALRAFGQRVGLPVPEPSDAELLATLGYPARDAYPRLLPAGVRDRWRELHALALDAMEARIRALGPGCWYEGARELLDDLVADGRVLVLASNASERYQQVHAETLGLRRWFRHLYHTQLPGISSKADMVARALAEVDRRPAVMIGDRASDRDAASHNAIPFIACTWGYGSEAEWNGAAATVSNLTALRRWLHVREQGVPSGD